MAVKQQGLSSQRFVTSARQSSGKFKSRFEGNEALKQDNKRLLTSPDMGTSADLDRPSDFSKGFAQISKAFLWWREEGGQGRLSGTPSKACKDQGLGNQEL
mmetsp:Transcript_44700/g.89747  ORF Transcript_44700/g.89747 Transcript_44700/m.89747 type:complete len:101 (+) Transcript_44700:93-395(+)|eukprot:CAMPEP_0202843040 /NCGR_PEP_ID=MMETSP1389-20130828/63099_1 /ASSEMBLY_ACC=CAM_ASM_000865 /TAXON_ID=302021 /ORGANISM="Rhodomonas sp., Strain CCMP768" /LENGTH=100 /DNA_ID=CAMNT_0049520121 /DNA_START=71 /DNA_END=373 /DNA_ORIENTATION=-